MIRVLTFAITLLIPHDLLSQGSVVRLSENHLKRITLVKPGSKRLVKYYKFYKRDSAKLVKALERKHKIILDSAWKAEKKFAKVERRQLKKGTNDSDLLNVLKNHENEMNEWTRLLIDTASTDSTKAVARTKIKELALEKARRYPGFQHLEERYNIHGDTIDWATICNQVPGLDTLSTIFESNPEDLFRLSEEIAAGSVMKVGEFGAIGNEIGKADELRRLPDQFMQYSKYGEKQFLKGEAKQHATDYFAQHKEQLQTARNKVSKLLSKYKEFSNSNDLEDAVKRTSLKGSTVWERLIIGGNFNVVTIDPVSIDLSPQLGFKFNTRFSVGISASYRYTFSDSIDHGWYVSPSTTSFRLFSNYDVVRNFYATAEWELAGVEVAKSDVSEKQWIQNYFVGVGRKFLVHPKLYMTLTALYNLNSEDENPVYPRRFQMRIGFQLSELATRKKKVYYDPNR